VVRDFTLTRRLERAIDEALNGVAGSTGFELQSHRIDLVGRCPDCRD